MTTTDTRELIRLADGITAYRVARDHLYIMRHTEARVTKAAAAGDPFANHEKARQMRIWAEQDLELQRIALEDEGIDWVTIDVIDGTEADA